MSPNHYIEDLRAERDRYRAVIRAAREVMDDHAWGEEDPLDVRDALYAALRLAGSTDSDPAATERQGEAEGAGDHV